MHSDSLSKNIITLVSKDMKLIKCLVVSSHVATLKHKAKHGYKTQKQLFQMLHKTEKQPFPGIKCKKRTFPNRKIYITVKAKKNNYLELLERPR